MAFFTKSRSFIENLPRIYGLYTGGFVIFVLLMALLERAGVKEDTIGLLFVGFTIFIYALIGWLSRTMQVDAYYVAGRQVPPVFNGMATAADWMSGASFVAMAGGVYMAGHPYLAYVVGWTGGYVLVAVLMAPYLRKFVCYTVPDFIGTRYAGNFARLLAVLVLVVASFTYVTAQINATGTIASRALLIPFGVGVWFGLAGILLCSMLGGMRAVTWTQVAQYIVLIIAYLVPVIWMSNKQGFGVIPQFVYGDAVARIVELEQLHQVGVLKPAAAVAAQAPGMTALSVLHAHAADTAMAAWKFIALAACMMLGTASLPHILMRYFTTPSVRDARTSVAWSLFFIFLLYFTAPALATFTKLQVLDPNLATSVIGKSLAEVNALTWVQKWSSVGFLKVIDANGDGIVQINEFFMRGDIVVLATPEIAGLPYVISGLVAAGGMAAAMSTADGLLLAIANALSHDLYYKMINPKADTKRRLIVARAAGVDRRRRRNGREPAPDRHPGRGSLGVRLRDVRAVFPAGARRMVEAREPRGGDRRHGHRPGRGVLVPLHGEMGRHDALDRDRRPALRHRRRRGEPDRHGGRVADVQGAGRGDAGDGRRSANSQGRHDPGLYALNEKRGMQPGRATAPAFFRLSAT